MSTPSEPEGSGPYPPRQDPPRQDPPGQYAPPYGGTPAYGDPGSGAPYGSGPQAGGGERPADGGADAGRPDPTLLPPPPAGPAAPARRRGPRGPAAVLLACLLSGGVGGAVAHALQDDGGSRTTTTTGSGTTITQTTSDPVTAPTGTAEAAAKVISPSVVTIAVTGQQQAASGLGSRSQTVSDTGSGIVLRADGHIVTNNHVVAAAVNGGTVSVTFADGSTVPAKIVGTDASSDLAVVKVDKAGLVPAVFADSSQLSVGQPVLAVGAPLGLSNTVTEGIVSTLQRPVRTGEAGASEQSVIDAVQTDAAINPGNSGGALVDLAGHVIGVNSAIASTGQSTGGAQSGNIGVGFAIPSNAVVKTSKQLIDTGKASHAQIGISAADAASSADGTPGRGALVQSVTNGGPADSAGLQQGDIVTKVDDRAVTDADSLIVAIRSHDPGSTVTVTYLRGGATQTAKATLQGSTG